MMNSDLVLLSYSALLNARAPAAVLHRFVHAVLDDPDLPHSLDRQHWGHPGAWTIRACPHGQYSDTIVAADGTETDVRLWISGYAARLVIAGRSDEVLDRLAAQALRDTLGGPRTGEQAHLLEVLLGDGVELTGAVIAAHILCPDTPQQPEQTSPPGAHSARG